MQQSTRGAFHSPASDASDCAAHKEPFPCAECRRVWAREDLGFRVCIAAVAVGALVCFGGFAVTLAWLARLM